MQIIKNPKEMSDCAIALGNFDGLHIAHTKIIKSCIEYAKNNNLKSCVLLFDTHTKNILNGEEQKLITTLYEKIEILTSIGVDLVFIKTFDKDFMKTSAHDFFTFLKDTLLSRAIFVGFDYKFGNKALGNISLLEELCKKNNIELNITDEMRINDEVISSSKIKELLLSGDVKKANLYLGRFYKIAGTVVEGKQNGRKMNFPTANIDYPFDKLLIKDGVYSGFATVDNKRHKCVINIGKNPTFNAKTKTVEAHIIDFSENLYGRTITLEFIKKIRDEIKFKTANELKEQIKSDIEFLKSDEENF